MPNRRCNRLSLVALILGVVVPNGAGVKINKLQVPEVIRHGAPVVLDCDFTLEATEEFLVVKWFFNENKSLVYQWIPGTGKSPQDSGILKGRLNLGYQASLDKNSAHRALHILEPGPDLSGDYTCSVSTFQSEDTQTKKMLVFVPERSILLRAVSSNAEYTKVQCKVDGVFPQPNVTLRVQQREIPEAEINVRQKDRLYDITATATLPTTPAPIEVSCELRIPQANYTKLQETVIFPGSSSTHSYHLAASSSSWWLLFLLALLAHHHHHHLHA